MNAIIKDIAAHFDAAADLACCNAAVASRLADARTQPAFSDTQISESMIAYAESHSDDAEVTNEEIIDIGKEWDMDVAELVVRLEAFCVFARAELLVAE